MNKIIAIVGPTASGKTKLAIDIAKKYDTEIISADSRLVDKEFDIATAKPTIDEQKQVKHHLIDIVEPTFDYSVANFKDDAEIIINKLHNLGKIPVIVGGTGLYFRILLENYDIPRVKADKKLREELEKKTSDELYDELTKIDNVSANHIHKNNKVRLIRVLEVSKLLNKPFSEIKKIKENIYNVEWIMPHLESREDLYNKINIRVDNMIEAGLIDETKYLLNKYGRIKNLVNTIGYHEIIAYFDGQLSFEDAVDKIKQNTRNYAKRQLTWFRRNPNLKINI